MLYDKSKMRTKFHLNLHVSKKRGKILSNIPNLSAAIAEHKGKGANLRTKRQHKNKKGQNKRKTGGYGEKRKKCGKYFKRATIYVRQWHPKKALE